MNVTYDQRLQDYMRAKGYCVVVFQEVSAIGCCADSSELYSRFAKAPEAEKLRAQGTWRIVEAPVGELFLARGLEVDDEVSLGLKSFLGVKDISYKGIAAWKL